ncbi:hypothetical protein [Alkaliphilus sp. B6464]|uniref:hypothetical protein n=1 Tax=Alkaliphilus sp. B6464 TaxID=2731219 RepID=UPI001BAA00F6|nr:hypothetical protein [Alkaliphilus sp. B6464]QUH22205.1 hypothetical protein HYG84_20065 [Alkaliphilus sp. B6464]
MKTIRKMRDMHTYKCTNTFHIPTILDSGMVSEEEYMTIQEGSLWGLVDEDEMEYYSTIDEEIILTSENLVIEISKEIFEKYFKIIE